eukprot:1196045-Prorocentrum_minimum.AAC.2
MCTKTKLGVRTGSRNKAESYRLVSFEYIPSLYSLIFLHEEEHLVSHLAVVSEAEGGDPSVGEEPVGPFHLRALAVRTHHPHTLVVPPHAQLPLRHAADDDSRPEHYYTAHHVCARLPEDPGGAGVGASAVGVPGLDVVDTVTDELVRVVRVPHEPVHLRGGSILPGHLRQQGLFAPVPHEQRVPVVAPARHQFGPVRRESQGDDAANRGEVEALKTLQVVDIPEEDVRPFAHLPCGDDVLRRVDR